MGIASFYTTKTHLPPPFQALTRESTFNWLILQENAS